MAGREEIGMASLQIEHASPRTEDSQGTTVMSPGRAVLNNAANGGYAATATKYSAIRTEPQALLRVSWFRVTG